MAYDQSSTYIKFKNNCTCGATDSSSCSCGCSESSDCSCCPVGTVAVYTGCGKHAGCLTPNDAELFNTGTHIPEEGYVKVIDPATGKYYGDLPFNQAIQYLDFIVNGNTTIPSNETFNILNPVIAGSGFYEITFPLVDGTTGAFDLLIDRVGVTDAVVVSIINSVEDIQFSPSGTTTVIPVDSSELSVEILWAGIAAPGVYTFVLNFATTNQTKQIPVRLTLS